jgi:outer membrane protein TolC
MRVSSVLAACTGLIALPLAAQQPDSAALAKARADSVAKWKTDSANVARDRERIKHEPRAHDSVPPVPPLRLTRQEAIDSALAHNPTIVIAREQVAQARARVTQATAFPDPSVGFTVQGVGSIIYPHPAYETDVIGVFTIPFPPKFSYKGQVAEGDVAGLQAAFTLQKQAIMLQTAQAYDSLLVSLKHRDDLLVSRQLAQDFLKKTNARFTAGSTARLDVVKAQVGVAQAENDLIANERGVANARAALNRLLGRILGAGIDAADTLAIVPVPDDLDRLERVAMERRPELYAIDRQISAARAGEHLAQQYWMPDLNVNLQYNLPYGVPGVTLPSSYTTGVGVSVPLFFWQHQNGEVAEAKHKQLELAATQRDVLAQVGQDLRTAYATATTSWRQAMFIRDQLLPSAEEQYKIAFTTYTLGGSSALEVIDSQSTLLIARNQFATALGALNDAVADLERAVGAPLDTTPSETQP